MINENMRSRGRYGFTLVELLVVIVILAIVLVIAVPKVMSVIEDSKKATLESTAKMIASTAEKQKVQNTVLGNTDAITCDSVAKVNNADYEDCDIDFDDNTAKVTIKGKGKFNGLWVCEGTKENATAQDNSCTIIYGDGDTYITKLLAKESELHNGLVQTTVKYNGTTYDEGIRYVGSMDEVNNQVYYNCESTDGTNAYGSENYNYASSCEVWRIIGVFDTKTSEVATSVKRIKLINTASTFTASWDSSASGTNLGWGVNQWGPSGEYKGADLMQLLNGYYIEKNDSAIATANKKECKYNNGNGQLGFTQTCDTIDAPLSSVNMKPLTSIGLSMIDEAV